MNRTHITKSALFGLAGAMTAAAMFAAVGSQSGPDAGITAAGPSTVSEYIVVAGNTPSPPPPRLSYQQAKRLGFVKPSNP